MADYPVAIKYTDFSPETDPLVGGFEEGATTSPKTTAQPCASAAKKDQEETPEETPWGVETITLKCGGKSSTSFDDQAHPAIPAKKDAPARFYFAPTEDMVDISWTLKNPEQAEEVTLEIYAFGGGAPVWQRTLQAVDAKKLKLDVPWDGSFPESEWVDTASFPAHLVTALHSPYMFKIRATGKVESGFEERWTYFDVLIHGIELEWGPEPEKVLPIAVPDPDDGRRQRHVQTNENLRDTTNVDNLSGLIPKTGENKLVPLKSNLFYQGESELRGANNEFFTKYKNLWGDGAMIPIMVNAKICSATDAPVDVPAALGKIKFLWDWEDKATAATPGIKPAIKTYVETLMNYNIAETASSPKGQNCHVDRGGKRGPGGAPVFPPQGGIAPVDPLPDADDNASSFPFKVSQCGGRNWAAVSETWTEGELAGKSGVIFQPSRMAGDAYALHVSLFFRDEKVAVDAADDDTEVYPEELSADTGTFTVWQDIDIAKYVQIGAGTTAIDMDTVKANMAKFFIKLNYDPTRLVDGTAKWKTGMDKIYDPVGTLHTQLAPYIQDALPTAATGTTLIEFKSYADFRTAWVARAGSEAAACAQALATTNPTNAVGEQKFDWRSRPQLGCQSTPYQTPWPIDHSHEVTLTGSAAQGKVKVSFDDPKGAILDYTIVFGTGKRVIKAKNNDLTTADKLQLATIYETCTRDGNGQYPPYQPGINQPIRVTLHGKTDTSNQARLANIRAALDRIVESSWHQTDATGSSYPKDTGGPELTGTGRNPSRYTNTAGYEWIWNIIQLVLFDQFPSDDGGIYLFQIGNAEMCNFNSPKAKAMFADATGNKIISVLSKAAKWPTLEHEIGHCKFVNHTYVSDVGNDPLELHQENAAGECTMVKTGVGESNTFCGLCMLRMRGWSIFKVTAPATGAFDVQQRAMTKTGV